MKTLTQEEFKKQYGQVALDQFDTKKEEDLFSTIRNAFSAGVDRIGEGINEARADNSNANLVTGVGKILGGAAQVISSPLAPVLEPTIGAGIDFAGKKIAEVGGKPLRDFAISPAGEATSKVAETIGDYAAGAGVVAAGIGGVKGAAVLPGKAKSAVAAIPKPALGNVQSAIRDIVPTRQGLIDQNLAKALDLTPMDLTNIARSTRNEVGQWMADNNLIGTNKVTTQGLINDFFSRNYAAVRSEITKVKNEYLPEQVPRLTDALEAIQTKLQGVVGLESKNALLDKMIKKEKLTLEDVQKTKELLDDYSSLYNKQGDVLQGIEKQGLANVRDGLKTFIEQEVQKNTGADIRQMNNNVSTAKTLNDAIDKRSTRGLTRANITWRDAMVGLGVYAFASPIAGLAAVVAYKLATSPTARLRFARWLDQQGDAKRASINEAFKRGEVPKEVQDVVGISNRDLQAQNTEL